MSTETQPSEALNKLVASVMRAPMFKFIGKGNLTNTGSWIQGVLGILILAGVVYQAIKTGQVPWPPNLDAVLGVILAGNAMTSSGIGRKIEPPEE